MQIYSWTEYGFVTPNSKLLVDLEPIKTPWLVIIFWVVAVCLITVLAPMEGKMMLLGFLIILLAIR